MKVAIQLQLDILTPINWLDFCFKALLSSYNVMGSPWWPLSAIKSSLKSKLPTTNYLSPWKYHKIDGDHSEQAWARCLHHWWWRCVSLAHAHIVHVLIVLPSLLCTWTVPTVLLECTKLQLQPWLHWLLLLLTCLAGQTFQWVEVGGGVVCFPHITPPLASTHWNAWSVRLHVVTCINVRVAACSQVW